MRRWNKAKKVPSGGMDDIIKLNDLGRMAIALWASEQSLDGFDNKVKEIVHFLNTDLDGAKLAAAFAKVNSRNLHTIADVRAAFRRKVGIE